MSETQELTFAKRLKEQTTVTHDSVDNLVMSVQPFSSKENYILWTQGHCYSGFKTVLCRLII